MNPFSDFNPPAGHFPSTGNQWGTYNDQVVRMPQNSRNNLPLAVYGHNANTQQWLLWQMRQDIDAGRGVVCFDPNNVLASLLVGGLNNKQVKDVVWFDLDDEERFLSLNPFPCSKTNTAANWNQWRETLFGLLSPLPPQVAAVLEFTLTAFRYSQGTHDDFKACYFNLWLFIYRASYRRYVLSTVPVAFLNRQPSEADFSTASTSLAPKLRPLFSDPKWQGLLTGWGDVEREATAPLSKADLSKVTVVTGQFDNPYPIVKASWLYAFYQRVGADIAKHKHPVCAYGLTPWAFNTPALDGLVGAKPSQISLTLAANFVPEHDSSHPRFNVHDELHIERYRSEILYTSPYFWPNHETPFAMKFTAPKVKHNPHIEQICKRYCRQKYGRGKEFLMADFGARFDEKEPQHSFFESLKIPARDMKIST